MRVSACHANKQIARLQQQGLRVFPDLLQLSRDYRNAQRLSE